MLIPYLEDGQFVWALPGISLKEPIAYKLLYPASGRCPVCALDNTYELCFDRMLLISGNVSYEVEPTYEAAIRRMDICLAPQAFPGLSLGELRQRFAAFDQLMRKEGQAVLIDDTKLLVSGAIASMQSLSHPCHAGRSACMDIMVAHLMLAIANAVCEEERYIGAGNRHVRGALRFMHARYREDISAQDVAEHVGIHVSHLHRLFLANVGRRMNEYLTGLRIEKAKLLLSGASMSVTEIAEAVGYSTQQYFNRLFKQAVGIPPQAYRSVYNITCDYQRAHRQYYVAITTEQFLHEIGVSP